MIRIRMDFVGFNGKSEPFVTYLASPLRKNPTLEHSFCHD